MSGSVVRPVIRAPRGNQLSCRGWHQEAALRMLMNNLDPQVAERPEELVVYGGTGKAARDWPSFHQIVATLRRLANDETLLIQSGKPVGVIRTHEEAPRVLIANSNLVPRWAGYCDEMTTDLDEALARLESARDQRRALSVGLVGNIAQVVPELLRRAVTVDILTDQTAAHDLNVGYIPLGHSVESAVDFRTRDVAGYEAAVLDAMQAHVTALLGFLRGGSIVFDYGNNLRGQVADCRGMHDAFEIPGFVPAYIRPLFCRGSGPFRWVALSGDPRDIATTDQAILETFPAKESLTRWIALAKEKVKFQGLPARICWLEYGERAEMGERFHWLVRSGRVAAPIVIGRDHLDCGSVASPNRETERMRDGSDAIADWPLLNALSNTACGASWVSLHHGGGVGIGYSIHAGMVVVADGTEAGERRLQRVLTADPALGIMRHADAGYEDAIRTSRERGVDIPMRPGPDE